MKRLLILRHAQALNTAPGGTDKTRQLSPNGLGDARALGRLMAREGLQPDAVLCSGATRTRETLAQVMEAIDPCAVDYADALYNADYGVLLAAIREASAGVETLLLVAHNPGVHMLAAQLAADDGSAAAELLLSGYAPATLSVMACDIADWADLAPHANVVSAVHETVEYNSDDRPTRWM